ncbi:MAG: glutamate 5-kinase [Pseudomonadota bacterium]
MSSPQSAAGVLAQSVSVVVKIGSSLLVDDTGLRDVWLASLAEDIAAWVSRGTRVTVVSSGAVALGRVGNIAPSDIPEKQACASVGQVHLSRAWQKAFESVGVSIGQVLLTPADTEHRRRHLNARATLAALHTRGCIAVINENDTVATEELRYGDNDQLAARVAQMIDADCLLLLSDVPGLLSAPPKSTRPATLIPWIETITEKTLELAGESGSDVGTGGMRSKLIAAQRATRAGATVIIGNGKPNHALAALAAGADATVCASKSQPGRARRRWIAGMVGRDAVVQVDSGAVAALRNGRSLLAVGVASVTGDFELGDCLSIEDADHKEVAVGLAGLSSVEVAAQRVSKSGTQRRRPLIHRDDLVVHDGDHNS